MDTTGDATTTTTITTATTDATKHQDPPFLFFMKSN